MIARRPMLAGVALAILAVGHGKALAMEDEHNPWGMIAKIRARPGQRAALIAVLNSDWGAMPGCIAYFVAEDLKDPDLIWVTEYWESKAVHDASLDLPGVKEAIAEGRPMIAGFEVSAEMRLVLGPDAR